MIYDILPINNYKGNNNSTTFDFDFYIDNTEQLNVYHFDKNNLKKLLELDVDYSINEIKNENGSYITFPLQNSSYGVLAEDEFLSLELTLPISQETQYNNSSLLNLEALEYSLDYLTRLIQILSRKLSLCVKVEECSDTTPQQIIDNVNSQAIGVNNALSQVLQALEKIETYDSNITSINEKISQYNEKFDKIDELDITKSNTDFSNLTQTAKQMFDGPWVILQAAAYLLNDGILKKDVEYTYSLADILPKDGFQYEVMISALGTTYDNTGNTANIYIRTDLFPLGGNNRMINKEKTQANTSAHWGGSLNLIVGGGRQIIIKNTGTANSPGATIWISGYRRLGTNI